MLSPIEKVMQWLLFLEKNILYPLTFLFAFGLSAHHYKLRFGDLWVPSDGSGGTCSKISNPLKRVLWQVWISLSTYARECNSMVLVHFGWMFLCSGAAAALTIAGMKILRTAWTDLPRQYFILIFTLFFFNFDYVHLSEGLPLDYFIIAILFIKVWQVCIGVGRLTI